MNRKVVPIGFAALQADTNAHADNNYGAFISTDLHCIICSEIGFLFVSKADCDCNDCGNIHFKCDNCNIEYFGAYYK